MSKHPSFGELELDWGEVSEVETPHSGVRRSKAPAPDATRVAPVGVAGSAKSSQELTRVVGDAGKPDSRSGDRISDPRLDELRELYAKGDADAALKFANAMAASRAPEPYADIQDDAAVEIFVDESPADRNEGTAIFSSEAALSHVAALSGTPYIAMGMAEVQKLPLDHRAGFLMSMIDGSSSISDLCDLAGMSEDDVVGVLTELARHKVIAFK